MWPPWVRRRGWETPNRPLSTHEGTPRKRQEMQNKITGDLAPSRRGGPCGRLGWGVKVGKPQSGHYRPTKERHAKGKKCKTRSPANPPPTEGRLSRPRGTGRISGPSLVHHATLHFRPDGRLHYLHSVCVGHRLRHAGLRQRKLFLHEIPGILIDRSMKHVYR